MGESARVVEIVQSVAALGSKNPVLVAVLRLKTSRIQIDNTVSLAVGRILDCDPARVASVAQWVDSLEANTSDCVIDRCVSVSCTSNGAQELWRQIEPALESLGLSQHINEVHCLSRCGEGPCMALGDQLYLGQNEKIFRDDRPWREAPFDQDS